MSEDAVLHRASFSCTQLPEGPLEPRRARAEVMVSECMGCDGKGRTRLGTSCQIVPFCWTQTHSVALRFGVTALRPLHAGWALGSRPLSFLWPRCFCKVSLSCLLHPGVSDYNDETDGYGERPLLSQGQRAFQRCRVRKLSLLMAPAPGTRRNMGCVCLPWFSQPLGSNYLFEGPAPMGTGDITSRNLAYGSQVQVSCHHPLRTKP